MVEAIASIGEVVARQRCVKMAGVDDDDKEQKAFYDLRAKRKKVLKSGLKPKANKASERAEKAATSSSLPTIAVTTDPSEDFSVGKPTPVRRGAETDSSTVRAQLDEHLQQTDR